MYWAAEIRYPKIADIMSNNRYKLLRRYIYVVDNTKKMEKQTMFDSFRVPNFTKIGHIAI